MSEKIYNVIFVETFSDFLSDLKFSFENRSNALMFAKGINQFNRKAWGEMFECEERNIKSYLSRGIHTANLLQQMGISKGKAIVEGARFHKSIQRRIA